MLVEAIRQAMWKRRVNAAQVWRDAERRQCAEHNAAIRRIIAQAPDVRDPAGRRR